MRSFASPAALPADVELLTVQYPGRLDRYAEPCLESMEAMSHAVSAVLAHGVRRPFAMFGHSMGAAVAYEVARLLETRDGLSPMRLFVSGRRSPSRRRARTLDFESPEQLWQHARRLGGIEQALLEHPEAQAIFLPPLVKDCRLVENWVPCLDPPLRCPITALVGDSDPEVSLDEAAAWSEATGGDFDSHVFEGDHFYLVPHAAGVVRTMVRALDVSQA